MSGLDACAMALILYEPFLAARWGPHHALPGGTWTSGTCVSVGGVNHGGGWNPSTISD